IRINDRRHARTFETLCQLDGSEVGRLRPAFNCNLAAPCVDADSDLTGKFLAGITHQGGVAYCDRAEDHARKALFEPCLDLLQRADAAAKLHRVLRSLQNGLDRSPVDARAGKGAIEVDHVE